MNSGKNNGESSNGLENIDIHGQEFLRDALTSCTDPLKAIEEIQVNNQDMPHISIEEIIVILLSVYFNDIK